MLYLVVTGKHASEEVGLAATIRQARAGLGEPGAIRLTLTPASVTTSLLLFNILCALAEVCRGLAPQLRIWFLRISTPSADLILSSIMGFRYPINLSSCCRLHKQSSWRRGRTRLRAATMCGCYRK